MKTTAKLICIVLASMLAGCMASLPKDMPAGPKTYKNKVAVRIMGSRRSYLVHVPPIHAPQHPLPLVVAIHGAFETAKDMEKRTGFSDLADQEGFVVVYPNGFGLFGLLQHWNAGHCCGKAAADGIDDVGFLMEVIEDAKKRLPIDPERIYMVGFSNGGMLALRFAAEKTGTLSALAAVAATIGSSTPGDAPLWRMPDPLAPLPLIFFHGLADEAIPAQGGISPKRGGEQSFFSVDESTDFWIRNNGCHPDPIIEDLRSGAVHMQTWQGCDQDASVKLYLLENWKHVWPGSHYTADLDMQNPLQDFNAAAIIWNFFKAHPRTP
jgi:polyhydroxybutyrate depolymerase